MNADFGLMAIGVAAGTLVGGVYFASLWHAASALVRHRGRGRTVTFGAALRLPAILAVLALAAQFGGEALAGITVGLLLARGVALRWLPARAERID